MDKSISHNSGFFLHYLNKLFIKNGGGNNRPRIYQSETIFPQASLIESHFDEIKSEISALLKQRTLTTYKEIDPIRAAEVSEKWKLFYILFLGQTHQDAKKACPTIFKCIKKIPNVINTTIAVLEPGVSLKAHRGPFAGMLRYHLGIQIPKNNPPSIRVDNVWYTWKENESIVLDDYFEHEVINNSDDIRVILMIDFLRPMNFIYTLLNRIFFWTNKHWSKHFFSRVINN